MNSGIIFLFVTVIMIIIKNQRKDVRIASIINQRQGGKMDLTVLRSYVGKKVRIKSIDSSMGTGEGVMDAIKDVWIILKDKKDRESLYKADYIIKIDVLS